VLGTLGITSIKTDWRYEKIGNGKHKGNITLESPVDVATCLSTPHHYNIMIRGSQFDVSFEHVYGLLTPTTCTTIALLLHKDDDYEPGEAEHSVEEHLNLYNMANGTDGTIDNVRRSEEFYSNYLLCDPGDIITAQGLCENPMPSGRFFRQVFFANAAAANYIPEYAAQYDRTAKAICDARRKELHTTRQSGSLVPLIIDIAPREAVSKQTPLDVLRQTRLSLVYEYHKRLEQDDSAFGARNIDRLHRSNVEIAENTPPRSEHDWFRAEDRFQEDSDALQTQLRIHTEIDRIDRDYEWAKARFQDSPSIPV